MLADTVCLMVRDGADRVDSASVGLATDRYLALGASIVSWTLATESMLVIHSFFYSLRSHILVPRIDEIHLTNSSILTRMRVTDVTGQDRILS